MLAEVQKLAVELNLTGNIHSAVPQAEQQFAGLNRTVSNATSIVSRGFGALGRAASGIGSALGHAKNQLVGLLTGPLGMLGLGAGLFSLGGLFKSGVDKAREFGGEVKRLAALTGLSVETTSKLASAFDHFGISADQATKIAGMAEKNLGLLTETQKKGGASTDQLVKAQERLRVAQVRLDEVESQRHVKASTLLAAQNRVADATRKLSELEQKHGSIVSKAGEFYSKYGLALTDASGKVKDFNTLLLDTADFWNNKTIPAQTKAVALQKLYGRSWQDLIPILAAGRAGITAAEQEAARLGLTLTKDNIDALTKNKEATRAWTDALGGLKLQIGLAVLPTLTDLAKGLTSLVVDNRERIVGFVKGVTEGARNLASAFGTSVLPAIKSVISILGTMRGAAGGLSFVGIMAESANFAKDLGMVLNGVVVPAIQAVVGAWNGLPDELRRLLITGFLANRVVKWTFGFDAVGFGLSMAKSFIGAVLAEKVATTVAGGLGSAASLLKPVPVFVTNEGFGNLPNVLAPAAGAGAAGLFGAGGILGTGLTVAGLGIIAAPIAAAVIVTLLAHQPGTVPNPAQSPLLNPPGGQPGMGIGGMPYGSASKPATVVLGGRDTDKLGDISADQKAAQQGMGALGNAMAEQRQAQLQGQSYLNRDMDKLVDTTSSGLSGVRKILDGLHSDLRQAVSALRHAATPAQIAAAAARAAADVGKGAGGARGTEQLLAELRKKREVVLSSGDKAALRSIDRSIAAVEKRLPGREWAAAQLAEAKKIVSSNESTKDKVRDLTKLAAEQLHQSPRLSAQVAARINALKADLHNTTARTAQNAAQTAAAIRAKRLAIVNNNTVNVSTYVSATKVSAMITRYSRFGTWVD